MAMMKRLAVSGEALEASEKPREKSQATMFPEEMWKSLSRIAGQGLAVTSDPTSILDRKFRIVWANTAWVQLCGRPLEDMMGRPCYAVFQGRKAVCAGCPVSEVFRTGKPRTREQTTDRADARGMWTETQAWPIVNDAGQVTHAVECIRDMGGHRDAEEAVSCLAVIAASSDDGILSIEPDGIVQTWNIGAERLYGYAQEEIVGRPISMLVPPRRPDEFSEMLRVIGRGERIRRYDTVHTRKDGTLIDVSLTVSPIKSKSGETTGVALVVRDISERKRVERALLESERGYRRLLENLHEGIWIVDAEGRTTFVNPRMAEMLGYAVDEMNRKPLFSFMDERGVEIWKGHSERRTGGANVTYDIELIRKDGSRTYAIVQTAPIVDDDGDHIGVINAISDITGRKQAEEALRGSEERYRDLVETIGEWIWEVDARGYYTYASPRVRDMLGFEPEEVLGKTPFEFMPPDETRRVEEIFWELTAARKPIVSLENTNLHKDGRLVVVETSGIPFFAPDGTLLGYRGVDRDVTERKRMEQALEAQAHHLEGTNAALKVLLKQREEDRRDLEDKILSNVRSLVLPYIKELKKMRLKSDQEAYVSILESNITNIVSPFVNRLSSKFLNLTPTETQVAGLIKEGKSTKEIAQLLHLSTNTILFHRHNLRTKLRLKNKRVNLRSYLQSLDK